MSFAVLLYDLLVRLALSSFLVSAAAAIAVLVIREPARRIRAIQWTLAGLVVLPGLLLMPGYPRLAVLPAASLVDEVPPNAAQVAPPNDAPESIAIVEQPAPETVATMPLVQPVELPPATVAPPVEQAPVFAEPPPLPIDEQPVEIITAPQFVADEPASVVTTLDVAPEPTQTVEPETLIAASAIAPPETTPLASTPAWQPSPPEHYRAWLVAAYGTGVLVMAAWSILGLAAVARLMRTVRTAPIECRILLRSLGGAASDRVAVVVSPRVMQPCALWWRKTTIVLPESLVAESDPQALRWALAHEWSHVERGDLAAWNASALVRSFYFYQPLVWWLRGQLQLCQDFVADAAAARLGDLPEDYAEFLTTSSFTRPTLAAGLGIGGRISDLQRRVIMLVERRRPLESKSPRLWNLVGLPIAVALVAMIAALAPQNRLEADNRLEAGGGRLEEEEEQGAAAEPAVEAAPVEEPAEADAAEPATSAEAPVEAAAVEPPAAVAPLEEALPVKPSQSAEAETPARKPQGTPAPAKAKHKYQTGVIAPDMIESKLRMHPVVAELSKQLTQAEWAIVKEASTAKNSQDSPELKKLAAKVELLKELLEAYKDEIRPQVALELAQAANQLPLAQIENLLPTEVVETVIENGKPVEKRRTVMQAVTKTPQGPRKIKPGDTLMISVQDNFQSLKQPGLQLLVPSGEALEVDEEGRISFGSAYGGIKVAGEPLGRTEQLIANFLLSNVANSMQVTAATPEEVAAKREQLVRQIKINVRLRFISAPAFPRVIAHGTYTTPDVIGPNTARLTQAIPDDAPRPAIPAAPAAKATPAPPATRAVRVPIPGTPTAQPTPATAPVTTAPLAVPVPDQPTPAAAPSARPTPAREPIAAPTFEGPSPTAAVTDDGTIKPGDLLSIELLPEDANKLVKRLSVVEPSGMLALGVTFGRVKVAGLSLSDAEKLVKDIVAKFYRDPQVQITHADATNVPPGFGLPIIPDATDAAVREKLERQVQRLLEELQKKQQALDKINKPQPDNAEVQKLNRTIEELESTIRELKEEELKMKMQLEKPIFKPLQQKSAAQR